MACNIPSIHLCGQPAAIWIVFRTIRGRWIGWPLVVGRMRNRMVAQRRRSQWPYSIRDKQSNERIHPSTINLTTSMCVIPFPRVAKRKMRHEENVYGMAFRFQWITISFRHTIRHRTKCGRPTNARRIRFQFAISANEQKRLNLLVFPVLGYLEAVNEFGQSHSVRLLKMQLNKIYSLSKS